MRKQVAPHIVLDERGIAYIEGTETKVLSVVLNKRVSGETPEELQVSMPHLSIAQVCAALSYYYNNCEDVEAQIAYIDAKAASLEPKQSAWPTRAELLARRREVAKGAACS